MFISSSVEFQTSYLPYLSSADFCNPLALLLTKKLQANALMRLLFYFIENYIHNLIYVYKITRGKFC